MNETKQHMDELETHIDKYFHTSAKHNWSMTSLTIVELERLKEEVRNAHRMTTEEIETLKHMMKIRAEEMDKLKHWINLIKLDVKKLFDVEWKTKKEIQKLYEEMTVAGERAAHRANMLEGSRLMEVSTADLRKLMERMETADESERQLMQGRAARKRAQGEANKRLSSAPSHASTNKPLSVKESAVERAQMFLTAVPDLA